MLDDIFLLLINIYGPQIVMYYLYAYYTVESGIKQFNWIELNNYSKGSHFLIIMFLLCKSRCSETHVGYTFKPVYVAFTTLLDRMHKISAKKNIYY